MLTLKDLSNRADKGEANLVLMGIEPTYSSEKSWGSFKVMDVESGSMTIKVTLNAGHSMNYHSHKNRDEVWVVISGTGAAVVDGKEQSVKAGDVITMVAGCRHTIKAETELKVIKVQIGEAISVQDKEKLN